VSFARRFERELFKPRGGALFVAQIAPLISAGIEIPIGKSFTIPAL
jgi:hypothetical protein